MIHDLMVDYDIEYGVDLLTTIETNNLVVFKDISSFTSVVTVQFQDSVIFTGDFYGLLRKYKVPSYLHYATLVLNGFNASSDFMGGTDKLYLLKAWFFDKRKPNVSDYTIPKIRK